MRRFINILLILSLALSLLFSLVGCGREEDCYTLLCEFSSAYGISRVIYSPSVREGEAGYITEDFERAVFPEPLPPFTDYSIFFLSHIDAVGECAVFRAKSPYDAERITEILLMRLGLLRSPTAGLDTAFTRDAFIKRYGECVVFSVLPDNGRARRIFDKIMT